MPTWISFIIGFFVLIFVGSGIAAIVDLWLHRKNLTNYPKLSDIRRRWQ